MTGLPVLTADDYPDTPVLPEQISLRFLKEFHLVGIAADDDKIIVAVIDPEMPLYCNLCA